MKSRLYVKCRVKEILVGTTKKRIGGGKIGFTSSMKKYCGEMLEFFEHPSEPTIFVYQDDQYNFILFHIDWLEFPEKKAPVKIRLFREKA